VTIWARLWVVGCLLGAACSNGAESPSSVSQSVEIAPWSSEDESRVREYLRSQSVIRAYIDGSPQYGHQSATLNVLRRVRALGFEGRFEVVFAQTLSGETNAERLAKLIPEFDAGKRDQFIASWNARFVDDRTWSSTAPRTAVELGLTGGMDGGDHEGVRRALHATYFLRLTPLHFSAATDNLMVHPRGIEGLPRALHGLPTRIPVTRRSDVAEFLQEVLASDPRMLAKMDGLQALLNTKSQVLMFQRPRDIRQLEQVYAAVAELRDQRADLFPHGCVIAVLYDASITMVDEALPSNTVLMREVIHRVDGLVLDAQGVPPWEAERAPTMIALVGNVPMPVYEQIMAHATLPVIGSGANTEELAWNLGRPVLFNDGFQPDLLDDDLPDDVHTVLSQASTQLIRRQEIRFDAVSRYLAQSLDEQSSLSRYYRDRFETKWPTDAPDKVLRALYELWKIKIKLEHRPAC
jgi:hypothetical protein